MLFKNPRPRLKYLPAEALILPTRPMRCEAELRTLSELSASIKRFGILSPLTVFRHERGIYQVVCGSRRLSAAMLAGVTRLPCLILPRKPDVPLLLSLAETFRRIPLDFLELADCIRRLTADGISSQKISELTGIPPTDVSASLSVLALPRAFLNRVRERGLTARHALALSALGGEALEEAIAHVIRFNFDADTTEKYVSSLRKTAAQTEKIPPALPVNDARLFLNTVERGVDTMRRGGVSVAYEKSDTENALVLTITLPREKALC